MAWNINKFIEIAFRKKVIKQVDFHGQGSLYPIIPRRSLIGPDARSPAVAKVARHVANHVNRSG
jgi:hypothetical protein